MPPASASYPLVIPINQIDAANDRQDEVAEKTRERDRLSREAKRKTA